MVNNKLDGWGRKIQDDKIHVGWYKDGKPHGYGIGNLYTNGQDII